MSASDFVRDRAWKRSDPAGRIVALLLRPLSWVFGALIALRSFGFRVGLLASHPAPIAVVSVGNLSVGGTGKTPFALWLARRLRDRGLSTAIVSRGYRGSARGVTVVSHGAGEVLAAELVGDEPAMMARSFAGVVVTAARRIDGVAEAARLGCTVAVLDDGFQHRKLARNFDIVLFDGSTGPLLPAGPLREGPSALRRADAIILTPAADGAAEARVPADVPAFRMKPEVVGLVESVGGEWQSRTTGCLAGKRVVAIVGIAHPERFYETIHGWDATIEEVFEYPDHHEYTRSDWQEISRRGQACDLMVTTEKDLVKLENFPFARGMLMALRIEPSVDGEERLFELILASLHGSPVGSSGSSSEGSFEESDAAD